MSSHTCLRTSRRFRLLGMLMGLACSACGGEGDGLTKFPVHGSVQVNGQPAEGMVVTFQSTTDATGKNAARPVGVTDADGRFELSTNGDKDGAVEGEYAATFFWPSGKGPMPTDRLKGRFSRPGDPRFKVKIAAQATELEPFRLDIDPKLLKPAPATATAVVK